MVWFSLIFKHAQGLLLVDAFRVGSYFGPKEVNFRQMLYRSPMGFALVVCALYRFSGELGDRWFPPL